jgi:Uma2 family endonuclease
MSTAVSTRPVAPPVDPDWIPSSLHRVTLDQYEAMVESGILTARDRVHLVNGCLVEKMSEDVPHATADILCGEQLARLIPPGWHVRPVKPIRIRGLARGNKPQPDRSIARGTVRDYSRRTPEPADIALVIEVSDSSLDDDRVIAGIYGQALIPAYWIVNLIDGQVEVYSKPGPDGYATLEVLAPGHVLTIVLDGVKVGQIAVEDILP